MNTQYDLNLNINNYKLKNPISLEDLDGLERNSVESINCFNVLELVNDPSYFLKQIDSVLRIHGECYFTGTSINLLCEYYLDNLLDINYYNSIILNAKRLYTIDSVVDLLKKQGFFIKSIKTYGIAYNIVVSRSV